MNMDSVAVKLASEVVTVAQVKEIGCRLRCPDCEQLPLLPVTGKCGHTRCSECIERNGVCPCGGPPPTQPMRVSIYVQDLITKILTSHVMQSQGTEPSSSTECPEPRLDSPSPLKRHHYRHRIHPYSAQRDSHMSRCCRTADSMSIAELLKAEEERSLPLELCRIVRVDPSLAWLDPGDLECIICYNTLNRPLTTECGHTFCRECILRTIRRNRQCAVCRHPLDILSIVLTSDSRFVATILAAFTSVPRGHSLLEEHCSAFLPIFDIGLVFPTSWCQLFTLEPCRTVTLLRILDAGKRRIGIVARFANGYLAKFGTIVEICDCVCLEDGRALVSAIGVSRFKACEMVDDGAHMIARAAIKIDTLPYENTVDGLKMLAETITDRAFVWFSSLRSPLLLHLKETFGMMPLCCEERQWWTNRHGPHWLWWIITVLPIRPAIQVLMLSTESLHKRMITVFRYLEMLTEDSGEPFRRNTRVYNLRTRTPHS